MGPGASALGGALGEEDVPAVTGGGACAGSRSGASGPPGPGAASAGADASSANLGPLLPPAAGAQQPGGPSSKFAEAERLKKEGNQFFSLEVYQPGLAGGRHSTPVGAALVEAHDRDGGDHEEGERAECDAQAVDCRHDGGSRKRRLCCLPGAWTTDAGSSRFPAGAHEI